MDNPGRQFKAIVRRVAERHRTERMKRMGRQDTKPQVTLSDERDMRRDLDAVALRKLLRSAHTEIEKGEADARAAARAAREDAREKAAAAAVAARKAADKAAAEAALAKIEQEIEQAIEQEKSIAAAAFITWSPEDGRPEIDDFNGDGRTDDELVDIMTDRRVVVGTRFGDVNWTGNSSVIAWRLSPI